MRTTADGLYQKGKEFEYYISDKNQYDTVINFLEKNSIIFAKNSPYFWSRSREEDLQPCPVCESKEKYENYRIFRDKTNGTISKSQFLSPEFKYIYKFPAEYEEYMRDMNELHNSEDDEIINPEYCALLEESKNCVNHSQLSNAFDSVMDIKRYLEGLLAIKRTEYSLELRLKQLLHQRFSAKQKCINSEYKLKKHGIEELEDNLAKINHFPVVQSYL